jgi:hypothetical protein
MRSATVRTQCCAADLTEASRFTNRRLRDSWLAGSLDAGHVDQDDRCESGAVAIRLLCTFLRRAQAAAAIAGRDRMGWTPFNRSASDAR